MAPNEHAEAAVEEILDVMVEHGYALDGDPEAFDAEKFLHAVLEAIQQDEDFSYSTGSWLRESAEALLAGQTLPEVSEGAEEPANLAENPLAIIVQTMVEHGYAFEGSVSDLDPEKLLHAVMEAVASDEDFSYVTGNKLLSSCRELLGLTEGAGKALAIGKGFNQAQVGRKERAILKRITSRRARSLGKQEAEAQLAGSGAKRSGKPSGWAS